VRGQLGFSSPELAAPWVESISDQNQRFSQIENLAHQWLETDRASAEAWLAKVSLPPDRRERLLAKP
jgi:hypothetical protein